METREILKKVQNGMLSVEEAEQYFRRQPFEKRWVMRNWILIEKSVLVLLR